MASHTVKGGIFAWVNFSRYRNNRKAAGLSTFACFMDTKKAFDTVNRDLLWFKLLRLGINGKMFNAIKSLYNDVQCVLRLNNMFTTGFDVNLGVKQGCNLSPTLFSIYINNLAEDIKRSGLGIDIDDYVLGILLYADDVVLLAPTEECLQHMLDIVDSWCKKWRLLLNPEKTKNCSFSQQKK